LTKVRPFSGSDDRVDRAEEVDQRDGEKSCPDEGQDLASGRPVLLEIELANGLATFAVIPESPIWPMAT